MSPGWGEFSRRCFRKECGRASCYLFSRAGSETLSLVSALNHISPAQVQRMAGHSPCVGGSMAASMEECTLVT